MNIEILRIMWIDGQMSVEVRFNNSIRSKGYNLKNNECRESSRININNDTSPQEAKGLFMCNSDISICRGLGK